MAVCANDAGIVGRAVGVGRGGAVGVGEAASGIGVVISSSTGFGVELATTVGVENGMSFPTETGTVISCEVLSRKLTRKRKMYSPSLMAAVFQTARAESVTG